MRPQRSSSPRSTRRSTRSSTCLAEGRTDMSFRVTPQTLSRGVLEGLQANLTRLQRTQEQLSSGRRLNRPSDSPVDTVNAMRVRAEKQQTQQYTRNIDDG